MFLYIVKSEYQAFLSGCLNSPLTTNPTKPIAAAAVVLPTPPLPQQMMIEESSMIRLKLITTPESVRGLRRQ